MRDGTHHEGEGRLSSRRTLSRLLASEHCRAYNRTHSMASRVSIASVTGSLSEEAKRIARAAPLQERAVVLALGDPGVGKTSLTKLLSSGEPSAGGAFATSGCAVEVVLVDGRSFVELWDVGAAEEHEESRPLFYGRVDGVLLVHDVTNSKSLRNLERKWIPEAVEAFRSADRGGGGGGGGGFAGGESPGGGAGGLRNRGAQTEWRQAVGSCPELPMLVVGAKADLPHDKPVDIDASLPTVMTSAWKGEVADKRKVEEFWSKVAARGAAGV